MRLTKYKLGELIEQIDLRNLDNKLTADDVRGISTEKTFIDTKANLSGVSLKSYKIVKKDEFAYVADTSRRGEKIALAYNVDDKEILISSIYTVFYVKHKDVLLSDYLFMYFNRPEFDRYSRFNSWGSARETFSWEDMCDIYITLPSIEVQEKYVNIYNSLNENQKSYERGLDDLKIACDAFLDQLKYNLPHKKIGKYLSVCDEKNSNLQFDIDSVKGISTEKTFIDTKANLNGVNLKSYKIVKNGEFAYVADTSRRGEKIALAYNVDNKEILISSIYTVFYVKQKEVLLPDYLFMYFNRSEFDRYARFNSWGSARETFNWEDMCDVSIPIPTIEIQKSISNIYKVYKQRKGINEKLKCQIKDICPILIKGSIEEARKEV